MRLYPIVFGSNEYTIFQLEQELDSLQKKVHEKEKSRLEEIEERKQKLDANAKRKKQLEDELSALKEDSKRLENEKIHLERSQRDSQQVTCKGTFLHDAHFCRGCTHNGDRARETPSLGTSPYSHDRSISVSTYMLGLYLYLPT